MIANTVEIRAPFFALSAIPGEQLPFSTHLTLFDKDFYILLSIKRLFENRPNPYTI